MLRILKIRSTTNDGKRRVACVDTPNAPNPLGTATSRPPQFRNNPAQLEHRVQLREPKRPFPAQTEIVADALQLLAVVGAAVPHAAAHGAGEGVFGDKEQELAAALEDA